MAGDDRRGRRPAGVLIAASILDSDLGALGDEIRRAEDAGADRIHLDVMDGHFVPNITFGWKTDRGRPPGDRAAVRRPSDDLGARALDREFLDAGCDSITFHVEVDAAQIRPALGAIRAAGRSAGLSVKPATPLEALDGYRDLLDIVLVMTVEPGFGGQAFMGDVAEAKLLPAATGSIRRARARSRSTAAGGSRPRTRSAAAAPTSSSPGRPSTAPTTWPPRSSASARSRAPPAPRPSAGPRPRTDVRALLQRVTRGEVRVGERDVGHRTRPRRAARRRARRHARDRRRAGPPDLRAADLRG